MKTLIQYLREIIFLLGEDRSKLPWLFLLFLTLSILDLIGLGLIGPYISLVVSPDMIIQGKIGEIFRYIGFSLQGTDLLISFGIVLISIFLVKAIVAIQIHRVIMRFIIHRQIKLQTHLMET